MPIHIICNIVSVMKKILVVVAIVLSVGSAVAQTFVSQYNYTNGQPVGVVYSLPRTELNVTLTVERTEQRPGPFYLYAERFLALKDVVKEEKVSWQLSDVALDTRALPDAERQFVVAPDKRGVADNLLLTSSGIIVGVNVDDAKFCAKEIVTAKCEKEQSLSFDMSVLGEEALTATSMPKMAELAARQIYRIRESRAAILACEVENIPDGKALKAILKRWEREEAQLLALFTGKKVTTKVSKTYAISPRADVKNYILARISAVEGLVDADDVIGQPIYLDVTGVYPTELVVSPKKSKQKIEPGFAYCVPGSAAVAVRTVDGVAAQASVTMPQFGYVCRLPRAITNKKGSVSLHFDTCTGAILSIEAKK